MQPLQGYPEMAILATDVFAFIAAFSRNEKTNA